MGEFYGYSKGRTIHKAWRVGSGQLTAKCGTASGTWLRPLGSVELNDPRYTKCRKCFG